MDVRIGVIRTPKEIDIDLPEDTDRDELISRIESMLAEGKVLWLVDRKGRRYGVPCSNVAYVEIGGVHEDRRVGFGAP